MYANEQRCWNWLFKQQSVGSKLIFKVSANERKVYIIYNNLSHWLRPFSETSWRKQSWSVPQILAVFCERSPREETLHIDGLGQDCVNSSAEALEFTQSCPKPFILRNKRGNRCEYSITGFIAASSWFMQNVPFVPRDCNVRYKLSVQRKSMEFFLFF